ncbi:hypothetical protein D779_0345 [Imhoffiella purpurea]|uniref:Uncharacterized protein n=2 Tax=Imhoffiella purpurea TaxID=1249627 RepID=W9VHD5_9GAMM|nr:hypothetical protein D779_0345 [Imhoffiella purpurea]
MERTIARRVPLADPTPTLMIEAMGQAFADILEELLERLPRPDANSHSGIPWPRGRARGAGMDYTT